MTSRDRVLCAIARQDPGRTPRDFWAEPATWQRLFAYVGHSDEERLLRDLRVDIRRLDARQPDDTSLGGGAWQNMWGERFVYRQTPWGPVREDMKGALAGATSLAELEAFAWPTPDVLDYSGIAPACRRHHEYALLYGFADVWERPALVRGWEQFLVDMVERPEWAHYLCRTFTDFYMEDYTRAQESAGGRIDLFLLLSDFGTQSGLMLSVPMFRRMVAPYLKEMFDRIHQLGANVLFHSCGMIRPLIPDLIALGVDVLDPLQPTGPEMEPEGLKADFGDQVSFHGGLDTQWLLPYGTPDQVKATVRRYCEALGPGYILAPAHLFQPDVPPENILAVYDA